MIHTHIRGQLVGGQPASANQYYFQPIVTCPDCGITQHLASFFSGFEEAEIRLVRVPSTSVRFEARTHDGPGDVVIAVAEHWCTGYSTKMPTPIESTIESYMIRIDQRLDQLQQQNDRKDAEIRRLHQKIEVMRMAHADQLAADNDPQPVGNSEDSPPKEE